MRRRRPLIPGPRFLEARGEVRVRFQEVDTLRVVWHGHYLAYFEEGRGAFGRAFGLGYADVRAAGFLVPLVHAECSYLAPARLEDLLVVTARLHPERAARITFSYRVERADDGRRVAEGVTAQAFTDLEGRLVLTRPRFYEEWLERWTTHLQDDG